MNRVLLLLATLAWVAPPTADAAVIFESGVLGPTGLEKGAVAASVVASDVFAGVRFQLTEPVVTSQVGGHFVDRSNGTFFGAIVRLDNENDFPNSGDLSTPDVLGAAVLIFPVPSAEVFGNLAIALDPGWYALVFGSGLFGAAGDGAAPLNNPDIGSPTYIAFQPGAVSGWGVLLNPIFRNFRFVVNGQVVPEPSTVGLISVAVFALMAHLRKPTR